LRSGARAPPALPRSIPLVSPLPTSPGITWWPAPTRAAPQNHRAQRAIAICQGWRRYWLLCRRPLARPEGSPVPGVQHRQPAHTCQPISAPPRAPQSPPKPFPESGALMQARIRYSYWTSTLCAMSPAFFSGKNFTDTDFPVAPARSASLAFLPATKILVAPVTVKS